MTSNKPYTRSERIEKQLLDIISSIALKNIDLSFLVFITFTDVDISPDLKNAKIFYSVLNQKLPDNQLEIEITQDAPPCKTIKNSFIDGEFTLISHKKFPNVTRWYARVLTQGTIQNNEQYQIIN